MTDEPTVPAVVKVARDLTELERLAADLEAEAIDSSADRLMPGGKALVAMAPVSNLEAWINRNDTAERLGQPAPAEDEDDPAVWEHPLATLLWWAEDWRRVHDAELDGRRATIATEAGFLRWCLDWAWDNEPRFDDFAADIRKARLRLEDLVHEGWRNQAGVRCFDCNVDLIRVSRPRRAVWHCEGHDGVCHWPHRYCPHDRGGLSDDWRCSSCERTYDAESYSRAVAHAHFVHAEYLPLTEAIDRTGAPRGSIQGWATRGQVRRRLDVNTGRMTYNVLDIEARRAGEDVAS